MSQQKQKYPGFDIPFPAGRFVLGSLTELQTKDNNGRDRKNPTLFIAVAIDKRDPSIGGIIDNIIGYTRHTYGFVPGGQQVQQRLAQPNFAAKSGFAWKIKDGDADPKWAAREGCPGNWIFCFGTSYAPARCCDTNFQQIDPRVIGLGDWVQVFSTVNVNAEVGDTAGIYLNPNGVMFLGTGQRIIPAGQSFEQMFGGRVAALPPQAQQQAPGGYAPQGGGYSPNGGNTGGYSNSPAGQASPGTMPANNGGYAPQAQQGGGYNPPAHAGGQGASPGAAPAQAYPGAGSAGHGGQPATAYPSNGGYAPNGAPPAAQHPGQYGGTSPQASGSYPPAAGQPGTGYQPGGGAPTAYPSNAPAPGYQAPPGVVPSYGFVNGPQR